MKSIRIIFITILLSLSGYCKAGEPSLWLSYGQSKFISSPGVEFIYMFIPKFGIDLGVNCYLQYPKYQQLNSIIHEAKFGFFSANLGLSSYLYNSQNHSFGIISGIILYYGPDYRRLRYYENGGYFIYYDGSSLQPDFGLDVGMIYTYNKISFLTKWDFARSRFRIGIGYQF
jgi:hypothetical protein